MFVYLEKELDLEAVQRAHQADQSASCQAHLLQGRKLNGSSGFDPQIDIIYGQRDIIQIGIDRYYIGLDRYYIDRDRYYIGIDRDRRILHRDRQGQIYIIQGQIDIIQGQIDISRKGQIDIRCIQIGIDGYIQIQLDRYQIYLIGIERNMQIELDRYQIYLDRER